MKNINLKSFFIIGLLVIPRVCFSSDITGQISSTESITISIQDESNLNLSDVQLEPFLNCWMSNSKGFAGGSSVNKAKLNSTYTAEINADGLILASLQIHAPAQVTAPPKKGRVTSRGCQVGVSLYYKIDRSPHFQKYTDYINPGLLSIKSKKSIEFTQDFINNLSGHYILKKVHYGMAGNIPLCTLALYKKTSKGNVYLGRSISYREENCVAPNPDAT